MKKSIIHIILSFMLMAFAGQVFAQTTINSDNSINNRAYVKVGIDPATLITVGYERKLGLSIGEKSLVAFAELGSSLADHRNSELKLGGILPLLEAGNFKIVNNLNLSAGTLTAKNFKSKKFAVADEITFGIYKSKWFLALCTEYEKIYLNHIEHSDFYKETYYGDAVDGWYNGAGGMFQFGLEGGRTFYNRIDLHMEFKIPVTEKFNSYNGSPAHINASVGFRF